MKHLIKSANNKNYINLFILQIVKKGEEHMFLFHVQSFPLRPHAYIAQL